MTASIPVRQPGAETAYKIWLGHTVQCAACRTAPCVTAIRLGRAWRKARR